MGTIGDIIQQDVGKAGDDVQRRAYLVRQVLDEDGLINHGDRF